MDFEIAYAIAGLVVGFAVGLTGIGGGTLMTPILHLGFGIPVATAVGTDLLYASITKVFGVFAHARARTVNWRIVGLLAVGSMPAAALTVGAIHYFGLSGERFEALIIQTLSAAVLTTAMLILLRNRLHRVLGKVKVPAGLNQARWLDGLTIVGGVIVGILVTLTSVGAGVLGTTLVLLLYSRLATATVIGTELAHAVPLTLIAGLGHLSLGTVDFALLASLLVGSLPGAYVGARVGTRLSDRVLRPILAATLMYIGWRLAFV
jgi:uncharacterized membrane protein YfcA